MSRRILVGLDPSEYSKKAVSFACHRAKAKGATVIGVAVVDLPGIEKASHGAGVGASHFAKKAREKHLAEATELLEALLAEFQRTCEAAGVAYEAELKSGDPTEEIGEASRSADLIVIGTRTYFHFETEDEPGQTLQELLKEHACPVLALPKELSLPFKTTLFPYDGSAKAAHSMREFATLAGTLPLTTEVTLLHVGEDLEEGRTRLARPTQYLEAYGYQVHQKILPGDPQDVILKAALEHQPAVVVIGSSSKSGLRAFLFGSVTRTLIEDGTIPLFISA